MPQPSPHPRVGDKKVAMSVRMLHKTLAMSSHALATEFLSHLVKQLPKLRSDHLARYFADCGATLPESVQTSPALAGLSSMSSDRSRPPHMSQFHPDLSQLNPLFSQLNPNLSQLNPNLSQLNPNLSQLNPNLSQLNPNLSQLNPNLSQFNPNPSQFNPQL